MHIRVALKELSTLTYVCQDMKALETLQQKLTVIIPEFKTSLPHSNEGITILPMQQRHQWARKAVRKANKQKNSPLASLQRQRKKHHRRFGRKAEELRRKEEHEKV